MFGYSSSNSSMAWLYRSARSSLPHQYMVSEICSSGSTVSPLPGSPPLLFPPPEQAVRASAAAVVAAASGRSRRLERRLVGVIPKEPLCPARARYAVVATSLVVEEKNESLQMMSRRARRCKRRKAPSGNDDHDLATNHRAAAGRRDGATAH